MGDVNDYVTKHANRVYEYRVKDGMLLNHYNNISDVPGIRVDLIEQFNDGISKDTMGTMIAAVERDSGILDAIYSYVLVPKWISK